MLGPVLQGDLISLEPPRPEDLPIFRKWFADVEVTRYLLMRFAPSEKQEEEWYDRACRSDSQVNWAIVANGKTVGSTSIEGIDWINRHGSTGTVIGEKSAWGKGFATEAVGLRTDFAFGELGLERLETHSFEANIGMHRALEKAGYQKIARGRRYYYRENLWHDVFIFELLRDEWESRPR